VVKYRKIPPAAAANQIAENARIPPAADLQKNNVQYYIWAFIIFDFMYTFDLLYVLGASVTV
jgi:hypothetical protein